MTTKPNNGRKPKGSECWCSACGEMFANSVLFDRHRPGAYDAKDRDKTDKRCLESYKDIDGKPMFVRDPGPTWKVLLTYNHTTQVWEHPI